MLDLTRLRVLVAVAREGSVTAAADALHYAQPSVSHHLARLEAEVGLPLTQRAGRGLRLTEAGELLARRAEEILGQVEAAETELSAHAGLRTGRVRLAAFPSALATLVPAAAARFAAAHPDVELALTEAEPPAAMTALRTGAVDVAVVFAHGPLEERGVTVEPLLTEPLYLVTPAAAELAGAELVDDALGGDVPAGDALVGDAEFGRRPAGRVPTLRAGTDRLARADPAAGAPAAGDAPAGDAPAGGLRAGDALEGDTVAGDAPAADARAELADDLPAGDVPAGAARADDAEFGPRPAGRVPTLRAGTDRLARADPAGDAPAAGAPAGDARAGPAGALAAFAGARWIAGCERCRAHLVASCERAGFTPAIAFETDDYVAVQALVAAGLGVSTLPGLALTANRHPGVRADPLPGDGRTVAVATYGRSPAPLPVQAFRTALREAAAEFTPW
ncbi:LysR substrate binding domain-containing protein [Jiangella alba]|uniref:LysR substrate binding domain-containing protein n=1 Tax=Jiangella alba TaxID=561176 RepID=A0A1H5PH42_9ACTN|nr:LysR substrate-binding domain-containing protein [Jiangella alba]SEF12964.1 LysR substrate binding domain-containing protein [Jiangella alba]